MTSADTLSACRMLNAPSSSSGPTVTTWMESGKLARPARQQGHDNVPLAVNPLGNAGDDGQLQLFGPGEIILRQSNHRNPLRLDHGPLRLADDCLGQLLARLGLAPESLVRQGHVANVQQLINGPFRRQRQGRPDDLQLVDGGACHDCVLYFARRKPMFKGALSCQASPDSSFRGRSMGSFPGCQKGEAATPCYAKS